MNAAQFVKLWHHCDWANSSVLEGIAKQPDPECLKIFAHLVGTQNVWLARLDRNYSSDWGLWDHRNLEQCRSGSLESTRAWITLLRPMPDARFEKRIEYLDTRGHPWTHFFRDIVHNVLNHSSHHRGQINLRLRSLGVTPPPLDYMVYLRTME